MDIPVRGDHVTIFWPGGPYDFVLEYYEVVDHPKPSLDPRWDDWLYLCGRVIKPEGPGHLAWRAFFVHPVEDGYALLPLKGRPDVLIRLL